MYIYVTVKCVLNTISWKFLILQESNVDRFQKVRFLSATSNVVGGGTPANISTKGQEISKPHDTPESPVADLRILQNLGSYLWPKDNTEFRVRLFVSLSLLVGAKVHQIHIQEELICVCHK